MSGDWRAQLERLILATEKNLASLRHAVVHDRSALPPGTYSPPKKVREASGQPAARPASAAGRRAAAAGARNCRAARPPNSCPSAGLALNDVTPAFFNPQPPPQPQAHAPPSYALLREGVSPRDPHLIAPRPSSGHSCGHASADGDHGAAAGLIPPFFPPPRRTSSGPPAQPCTPPLAPSPTGDDLDRLRGELAAVRASALGWQQVAASAAGVDARCAQRCGELAAGVAGLQAAQGRLEDGAAAQQREVAGRFSALASRVDALAAAAAAAPRAAAYADATAGIAPDLAARLAATEAALSELQAGIAQRAEAMAAAAAAHDSRAAEAAAAVAGLQADTAALRAGQERAAEQLDAQGRQVGQLSAGLRELQGSQAAAQQQAAQQEAELASQLAGLQAAQAAQDNVAQHHASALQQLAAQLDDLQAATTQLQQQQEQRQELGSGDVVSAAALQALEAQAAASAGSLAELQGKVGGCDRVAGWVPGCYLTCGEVTGAAVTPPPSGLHARMPPRLPAAWSNPSPPTLHTTTPCATTLSPSVPCCAAGGPTGGAAGGPGRHKPAPV